MGPTHRKCTRALLHFITVPVVYPAKALAGTQSRWSGAKRLWTFHAWHGSTPYLLGATEGEYPLTYCQTETARLASTRL